MPLVECTAGPAAPYVAGTTYEFVRDRFGRFVATVDNPRHLECLLGVVHFRVVADEPPPATVRPGAVTAPPPPPAPAPEPAPPPPPPPPPAPKPDIATAVRMLDPDNDAHWTKDHKPQVDDVSALVGRRITRQEIDAAAPGYLRPGAVT